MTLKKFVTFTILSFVVSLSLYMSGLTHAVFIWAAFAFLVATIWDRITWWVGL